MYKIDKDVPPPPEGGAKYPFPVMEIGDSFVVSPMADGVRAVNASLMYGKNHDLVFASRTEGNGKRIWRIA